MVPCLLIVEYLLKDLGSARYPAPILLKIGTEELYRDFSRFSEDRPTHTEYGFEAVTLCVCPAENPKISKFQKFVGLDGDGRTRSGPPYAVGSC